MEGLYKIKGRDLEDDMGMDVGFQSAFLHNDVIICLHWIGIISIKISQSYAYLAIFF